MIGIGIESSCDESGVGIVKNGVEVLAAPLFSQINMHLEYGGVVPEYASRAHLEKFPALVKEALQKASINNQNKPDFIAATIKPGLVGSLLVGYSVALALRDYFSVPLVPVHHLMAHFAAVYLSGQGIEYPALGLLVSGGNTALYRLNTPHETVKIADTCDDAIGEALDKAAIMLGFGYPGGPAIERAAQDFTAWAKKENVRAAQKLLPQILKNTKAGDIRFSFSGLKTSLLYTLKSQRKEKNQNPNESQKMAYAFEYRAVEHILRNVEKALNKTKLKRLIAAGGVMANLSLRRGLEKICTEKGVSFIVPEKKYCTDNGAMVASAGWLALKNGVVAEQNFVTSENDFSFCKFRGS